ncbi:MAG: single-stranded-DNA-specific exonuclease RecJ [Bacteroidota bacterium]
MKKRWTILHDDKTLTSALYDQLKIHPILCKILAQRGIDSYEKARSFFRPSLADLHDPFLMKGMQEAVSRILTAIDKKEKILIYGDYDVDGTTSVACMYLFLKKLIGGKILDFYIPHRYREGYGISKAGVDYAIQEKFSLVIALDCGIKSTELIQYAKENKVDFIVCDHHLPDASLPPAVAILNPKQVDCPYPFKELCGCGVGFKLISALAKTLGISFDEITIYLDLVATAIAADIVSMTGENRILAWYGLKQVNESPSMGIKALMQVSNARGIIKINNLVFMIAPRVNAAGRMDDARKAVQMFISDSIEEATEYAKLLHADNDERKEADSSITEEALQLIQNNPDFKNRRSTVVFHPQWHKGVVGIVASRLIEHHYKPTIVLTQSGEVLAGSARSVSGFDLYEAIHECREHLITYGGHFAAAGLSLKPENLHALTETFEAAVSKSITEAQLVPEIIIDAELSFDAAQLSFLNIIEQMEPFGPNNLRPVFMTRNTQDTGYSKVVKEHHLQLFLRQANTSLKGIFFKAAPSLPIIKSGPADIVYTLEQNEYKGEISVQLKIMDLRSSY